LVYMPDWKVHLIFGLLLLSLWLSLNQIFPFLILNFQKTLIFILLVLFVSIFPDIDMKKSKSREIFAIFIAFLVALIYILIFSQTWYYGLAYFFLVYYLITLLPTKHRGITHTLTFSTIFSILTTSFFYFAFNLDFKSSFFYFLIIFSVYFLHLLLDKL
jgi:inner membrane protein